MPYILRSPIWPDPRVKPPLGAARIKWGHPLAPDPTRLPLLCLFDEGVFRNLVRPTAMVLGTAPRWAVHTRGRSLRYPGTSSASSVPLDLSGTAKVTIDTIFSWDRFANNDLLAAEFTTNYNGVNAFIIDPNSSAPTSGVFQISMAGLAAYNGGYISRPSAGIQHIYAFTLDRTTGAAMGVTTMVDGVSQVMTQTNTSSLTGNFLNDTLYLFGRAGTGLLGIGFLTKFALYTIILSSQLRLQLAAEPYAMLEPIVRRRYFVPAAAAAGESFIPVLRRRRR